MNKNLFFLASTAALLAFGQAKAQSTNTGAKKDTTQTIGTPKQVAPHFVSAEELSFYMGAPWEIVPGKNKEVQYKLDFGDAIELIRDFDLRKTAQDFAADLYAFDIPGKLKVLGQSIIITAETAQALVEFGKSGNAFTPSLRTIFSGRAASIRRAMEAMIMQVILITLLLFPSPKDLLTIYLMRDLSSLANICRLQLPTPFNFLNYPARALTAR